MVLLNFNVVEDVEIENRKSIFHFKRFEIRDISKRNMFKNRYELLIN